MKILESRRDDSSGRPFQKLLFHCARTHDFITPPLSQLSSALTEDSKCTISHPSKKPDSLWDPQKWWCFHWLSAQTTWSLTACVFFSFSLSAWYLSLFGWPDVIQERSQSESVPYLWLFPAGARVRNVSASEYSTWCRRPTGAVKYTMGGGEGRKQ